MAILRAEVMVSDMMLEDVPVPTSYIKEQLARNLAGHLCKEVDFTTSRDRNQMQCFTRFRAEIIVFGSTEELREYVVKEATRILNNSYVA